MPRFLALIVFLLATPAVAQTGGGPQPAQMADSFFRTLQSGQTQKAFDDSWRGTLMSKKQAEVEALTSQLNAALQIYGKIGDWELVSDKQISPNFDQRIYLARTPNAPLFFRMQYYRASSNWVMSSVFFTDTYEKIAD